RTRCNCPSTDRGVRVRVFLGIPRDEERGRSGLLEGMERTTLCSPSRTGQDAPPPQTAVCRSLTAARAVIGLPRAIPPGRPKSWSLHMNTPNSHDTNAMEGSKSVTAQRVEDARRLGTLPRYFGDRMMRFGAAVFDFMHRFSPDYRGGFWQFYELSNGGFY